MELARTLNEVQICLVNPYTKEMARQEHLDTLKAIYRKAEEFRIDKISIRNIDEIELGLVQKIIEIARSMPQTTVIKSEAINEPYERLRYESPDSCSDCYAQIRNGHIERLNLLYDGHPMFCGRNVNDGISKMYLFQNFDQKRLSEYLSDWNFTKFFFDKEECRRCLPNKN